MTPLTPARLREMIECASKATPGPWSVGETRHEYDCVIRNKDRDPVALTLIAGYAKGTGTASAAHIAACSPEVIIALCRIALAAAEYVEAFGNNDPLVEPYTELRDALREAGL